MTVTVAEINSRRVYVTGEVTRPGAYPLLPNMTALQAINRRRRIYAILQSEENLCIADESGKQVKHPFNYKAVLDGKQDDIPLQPG